MITVITVQPASPYAGTDRLATLHRSGPVPLPGLGPGPGPAGSHRKRNKTERTKQKNNKFYIV